MQPPPITASSATLDHPTTTAKNTTRQKIICLNNKWLVTTTSSGDYQGNFSSLKRDERSRTYNKHQSDCIHGTVTPDSSPKSLTVFKQSKVDG